MRNTALLLSFLLASTVAQAVPVHKSAARLYNQDRPDADFLRSIIGRQVAATTANKGTAMMKRLKAHSYVAGGVLEDSSRYIYSHGRGSSHPDANSYYQGYYPTATNPDLYIMCDTAFSFTDYSGQGNFMENTRMFGYDANNNVAEYITMFDAYAYGYKMTYNTSNQPTTVTIIDMNGTTPMQTSIQSIVYNGGKRIMDSTYNLILNRPVGKRAYTYDAGGNRTLFVSYTYDTVAATWAESYKSAYRYDNNNRIVSTVSEYNLSGGTQYKYKDSMAYTGTAGQCTFYGTYNWEGSAWIPNDRQDYTLTASGLIGDYIYYNWNGNAWDTIERDVYTYSNDLLQRVNGYYYMGNGTYNTTPYDQTTYYWEDYDPTSINNIAKETIVSIYPNPATDVLTIDSKDVPTGSVRILNLSGQLMLSANDVSLNGFKMNIDNLPKGNYVAVINNAVGQRVYRMQFTKL